LAEPRLQTRGAAPLPSGPTLRGPGMLDPTHRPTPAPVPPPPDPPAGAHALPSSHTPLIHSTVPEVELSPKDASPPPPPLPSPLLTSPQSSRAARRSASGAGDLGSPRSLTSQTSMAQRLRTLSLSPQGSIKLPHAVEVLAQPLAPEDVPPPTVVGIWKRRWQSIVAMTSIYVVTIAIFPGFLAEDVKVGEGAGLLRLHGMACRAALGGFAPPLRPDLALTSCPYTPSPRPWRAPHLTPPHPTPSPSPKQNLALGSWYPVILFLVFNVGDLVGKLAPHFNLKPTQTVLLACCLSRIVFLPAFFCG
jgi:hypothetical protein